MRCLRDKLALANHVLDKNYREPIITYQQRGTAAGTAWLEKNEIRLNPTLLLENQQAFIDEVVPHELAHILVWRHFGRVAPHGKEWKWMMADVLGVTPRRTHQFAVQTVSSRHFLYRCACQEHALSIRRHNRVLRGETSYRCKNCGTQLTRDQSLPEIDL